MKIRNWEFELTGDTIVNGGIALVIIIIFFFFFIKQIFF